MMRGEISYDFLDSLEREEYRRRRIEERCKQEGQWLLDHQKDSIRKIAIEFRISKSQLHRDLHELMYIDDDMYVQVMRILKLHRRNRR